MAKNNVEFGEGPIFTLTNYFIYFTLGNIYIVLLNLPIIFILAVILSNGINQAPVGFNVIIFISCLPIGAAATALFSVIGKLVRDKDISITKDLFRAYKQNFLQATFLWFIEILSIMVLFVIARFLSSRGFPPLIVMFYYWLILFIFILGVYMLLILSRFKMKSIDILKLSLYFATTKIRNTLLNIIIIFIVALASIKVFIFILPFAASVVFFIIMLCNQKILLEIEDKHCIK